MNKEGVKKFVEGVKARKSKLLGIATVGYWGILCSAPMRVLANEPYKFINQKPKKDALGKLTKATESIGQSAYIFFRKLGVVGLLIAFACIGLGFMVNKSAAQREQNKSWAFYALIGAGCVFGAFGLISIAYNFGQSIG